jgi:preprotein translocase subunit SecF
MKIFKDTLKINFVGAMNPLVIISGILVISSIVLILSKGLNYGIDFKGGVEIQVQFKEAVTIGDVRSALDNKEIPKVGVQAFGDSKENEYLLRLEGTSEDLKIISDKVKTVLKGNIKTEFTVRRTDMVGSKVGDEFKQNGFWSIVMSLIFILIYIAFRFDTKFAPGAVIALGHDVMITIGVFILLGKEFNLAIIAALLTIVGYSLNDTIIVFDRIRENMHIRGTSSLKDVVNISLNQTLSRTVLTSITTLFVLVSLLVWGGPILHDFAFAMCLGVLIGTYSSIFIASPMILVLHKYMNK